jgi:hypothetical protein
MEYVALEKTMHKTKAPVLPMNAAMPDARESAAL